MKPSLVPGSSDQEFYELLENARLGDPDALGTLIDRYRPYLMKLAYREGDTSLQGKEGDSDLVQNTCVKALHVFEQFQGTTSHEMRAWLRKILLSQLRIARNRYLADKRHVQAEVPLQHAGLGDSGNVKLAEDRPPPAEAIIHEEERVLLEVALQELTALDRRIIEMRQKEGRTFAEIALQLNVSEEAAQKRWARALQTLQEKVRRLYDPSSG